MRHTSLPKCQHEPAPTHDTCHTRASPHVSPSPPRHPTHATRAPRALLPPVPNYRRVLPPHSYINIADFADADALIAHLEAVVSLPHIALAWVARRALQHYCLARGQARSHTFSECYGTLLDDLQ